MYSYVKKKEKKFSLLRGVIFSHFTIYHNFLQNNSLISSNLCLFSIFCSHFCQIRNLENPFQKTFVIEILLYKLDQTLSHKESMSLT